MDWRAGGCRETAAMRNMHSTLAQINLPRGLAKSSWSDKFAPRTCAEKLEWRSCVNLQSELAQRRLAQRTCERDTICFRATGPSSCSKLKLGTPPPKGATKKSTQTQNPQAASRRQNNNAPPELTGIWKTCGKHVASPCCLFQKIYFQ